MNCDHSFEKLRDLLRADRSIRRFVQERRIDGETLERLVELTRYCASGRNAQPLRYRAVWTEDECAKVFPHLAWAGYYTDWAGPEEGDRPAAYLVQCLDTDVAKGCLCDDGIQLQALTLGAAALGIGGCIIKSFNAKAVSEALGIDPRYQPLYVLALGHPAEEAVITEIGPDGDFRYHRDEADRQCVPKRPLSELLIS